MTSHSSWILDALTCLKLVVITILVLMMLQFAYVSNNLISEIYDSEIVEMAQTAFYLGGLIGVLAMTVLTLARSVGDVAIDICLRCLKLLKNRIIGNNQKYSTQAKIGELTNDNRHI